MSSPQMGKRPMIAITDEMAIRQVLPRNGPKLLARLMDVPIDTAKWWYYRHLSAARRRAVALALLSQMDAEEQRRAELRSYLARMAGNNDQVGGAGGGDALETDRRPQNSEGAR